MNIDGIFLLNRYGQGSFCYKNRIFSFVNFGIMPFNNTFIYSICNFYIVGCRGKTYAVVKIHTISFKDPIVVFNLCFVNTITCFDFGIVKAFFTIGFLLVRYYGGWSL